jgi:hypothetical protein
MTVVCFMHSSHFEKLQFVGPFFAWQSSHRQTTFGSLTLVGIVSVHWIWHKLRHVWHSISAPLSLHL